MLLSASLLLLTATSPQVATDIVPVSLGTLPNVVEIVSDEYDWKIQRSGVQAGVKLADSTANCNTAKTQTNFGGRTDQVPDCGFD
jgi:hypothetical protein